jgi:hypothetical protein
MAEHGSMDITQHRDTYAGVMTVTKWVVVVAAITLVLMGIFLT